MTSAKKKLLVVAGAGASVDLGLPGVSKVGEGLRARCRVDYPLTEDPGLGIYDWLEDRILTRKRRDLKPGLVKEPNFEEILYAVFMLATLSSTQGPPAPYAAFLDPYDCPAVGGLANNRALSGYDWTQLGTYLADVIIEMFRKGCRDLEPARSAGVNDLRTLFQTLAGTFDIAVVTLNYDDAIWRVLPGLETGFDVETGRFDEARLFNRAGWSCFLHLHGSAHFDMVMTNRDMHEIVWRADLSHAFAQNAAGRSGVHTTEGAIFAQSVVVAGYGKTQQILRRPFRTYYSEVDRLVSGAEALLCLGYGFADAHLNAALESFRDARDRPVVLIDYAPDDAMTAATAHWDDDRSISRALGVLRTRDEDMTGGRQAPQDVRELKQAFQFDLSTNSATRLAIWYNGMAEACKRPDAVLAHLI